MDLSFSIKEGVFNYRACAVITQGERLLVMKDERTPYYYLPGGRVRMQETAEQAVLRELREELEIEARLVRLLWFCQSFFTEDVTGERFHELCLYYLVDTADTDLAARGDCFSHREREHRQVFTWLPWEKLDTAYLYPAFLKRRIFRLPDYPESVVEREPGAIGGRPADSP